MLVLVLGLSFSRRSYAHDVSRDADGSDRTIWSETIQGRLCAGVRCRIRSHCLGLLALSGGRVDPRLDAADVDAPSHHPPDVVRLRGAGLHEPGARQIRGWLRHPMLVSIKIWALAHLLANGDAGGMLLSGRFSLGRCSIASPSRARRPRSPQNIILHARRWRRARRWNAGLCGDAYLHPVLIGVPVIGH